MTDTTLTLTRRTLGVQRRPFGVLVDGSPVATIDYGQTIDLRLAPARTPCGSGPAD